MKKIPYAISGNSNRRINTKLATLNCQIRTTMRLYTEINDITTPITITNIPLGFKYASF